MRIERYTARDTRTAMAKVRAQLGADALILANRRIGNQVEVTAALDIDEALDTRAAAPGGGKAASPANEIQLKALERELHRLRGILEKELGQSSWRDSAGQAAPAAALRQRLLRMGLSRSLSGTILDALPRSGRLETLWGRALADLAERLPALRQDRAPRVTAVYGATGVGKTSAVARLAARDLQRHGARSVGLITLDSYRLGAQEQLASFADVLGLPMHVASDVHSLSVALREMAGRRVYIDTAGMAQHDARLTSQFDLIAGARERASHLLVLSASAQASQCRAVASAFGRGRLSGAIISKVDEAQSLGGVLDVVVAAGLPLFGYSDGQRIPDDFHTAGGEALVARAAALLSDPVSAQVSASAGPTSGIKAAS